MSRVRELIISYRKETENDFDFLVDLYGSTRIDVAKYGNHLNRKERMEFIANQFKLQSEHYAKKYKKAKYQIIQHEGKDVGRIVTNKSESGMHVVFFALIPSAKSIGIGKFIFRSIIDNAHSVNKIVSIYVNKQNKNAKAFYEKLGFVIKKGGTDFYDYMETEI